MQFRNSFAAGLILAAATVAPLAANAQSMMLAPLPPPRPFDLAVAAPTLDPDAALRSSVEVRHRVDRQQIVMQRADRDVPMPRAVPSIMAPVQR
ncbi:MAG: hypothetical protein Q8S58_11825 [Bosea sp. (in: a-proteobacteria)]|uniref:hypothetical protein n=1 Tax=Bosea sp. (in: a-proteobacteria) TaxID=1871050 RepID=UPI0027356A8B|nr:hypothetical protein [Bosea sp. (in: a-proteobacteria)]MDP3255102.1 hypothetical protein [Bosea sp. (in: a-proteobacteria)]MDP3319808.1 hypothetical protein [Bosea sp. (in: a-proteobacteria)]